jgi:putative transposase
MPEYRTSSHAVYNIKYHIIWVTKYRYQILGGNISKRLRELICQGCEAKGITIVSGNIRRDHIRLLLSCPPSIAPSKVVQYLKGRSSRLLQEEFQDLRKRYWGQHLWGRGYFCATVGNVTEEIIKQYIENQEATAKDSFKIEE